MQVTLRRAEILVPGEFLGDDWIASIFQSAWKKLVADCVPREAFASSVVQPSKSKQLLSHDCSRGMPCTAYAYTSRGRRLDHVDVMDGQFVPNITIGPLVVRAIKRIATRPLDVYLMIEEPERYDGGFDASNAAQVIAAGADILVAGDAIFSAPDAEAATRALREGAINAAAGSHR